MTSSEISEIKKLCGFYDERISSASIPRAKVDSHADPSALSKSALFGHLRWMLELIPGLPNAWKQNRWIGFVQGVLFGAGVYTIDQLKTHVREAKQCDGSCGGETGTTTTPPAPSKISAESADDPANPKDRLGVKKVSLTKLPATAIAHASHAMMDGAEKYGPYNWRDTPVRASIYIDACERHLNAWFDGEEEAVDSGVHHLGHAMACLAILLDAQETGNLVDDRPVDPKSIGAFCRVLNRLNKKIAGNKSR